MASRCFGCVLLVLALATTSAAADRYFISTAAGGAPTPTPVPALSANIQPYGVASDESGNIYFTSSPSYVSSQCVYKMAANGMVTRVAGTGRRGFSGDGGPAIDAQLSEVLYIAASSTGDVYLSDIQNNRIRRVGNDGVITTVIGGATLAFSGDGGPATAAGLNYPTGLAVDNAGNLYFADANNHRIRKMTTAGIVQTIAGNGAVGNTGDGGPALQASIGAGSLSMLGLAVDANGAVYVAVDNFVRKISADGTISTVAGTGQSGTAGDGGLAVNAQLLAPANVATDGLGNLYISGGSHVQEVSAEGIITTFAGTLIGGYSGDGGRAASAQLDWAYGVAADGAGNLFVADVYNCRLRKVSPDGVITTAVGDGKGTYLGDSGPATAAQLNLPTFVGVDNQNNLLISDFGDNIVRRVSASGEITTIVGSGVAGSIGAVRDGQPAPQAAIGRPGGVVSDVQGNIYVADSDNACVWIVDPNGRISRFAGNGNQGYGGDGGRALDASFVTPWGLALDGSGNLYIADENDQRIRKVSREGMITTVAGNGASGFSGDGGPATSASFNRPQAVAVAVDGSIYVADYGNGRVRKVSPDGIVRTIAGDGVFGYGGDGIPASTAHIIGPNFLALDGEGNVYFSGLMVFRISTRGMLSIVAGSPEMTNGYSGDGGPATQANFSPYGLAVGADGRIYFADGYNSAVRVLVPVGLSVGRRR